ncbi:MAG: hypothetical protein VYA84_10070, partial [Planctomycetota bacterium]|nr:hypothetical protein [Planctomycetota bacterium]
MELASECKLRLESTSNKPMLTAAWDKVETSVNLTDTWLSGLPCRQIATAAFAFCDNLNSLATTKKTDKPLQRNNLGQKPHFRLGSAHCLQRLC